MRLKTKIIAYNVVNSEIFDSLIRNESFKQSSAGLTSQQRGTILIETFNTFKFTWSIYFYQKWVQ